MKRLDIITGFLGSGKTSFLKKYARACMDRGEKICILENDFGAINVDMVLLQELLGESCDLEMIVGGDGIEAHKRRFKTKLIAMGMKDYDRVIIEPSGIFDVDEVFDLLYEEPLESWYCLDNLISIVDASMQLPLSDESRYLLASESACAGRIILSKCDIATEEMQNNVIDYLKSSLEFIKCSRELKDKDFLIKDMADYTDEDYRKISNSGYKHADFEKRAVMQSDIYRSLFYFNVSYDTEKLKNTISGIFNDKNCGNVHRIKGFVKDSDDSWLEINAVSDKTELACSNYGQNVIIIIGEKLNDAAIRPYWGDNTEVPEW